MRVIFIITLILSSSIYANECDYNQSAILKLDYEQILEYAKTVDNLSCVNNVLDNIKDDSNPNVKMLKATLLSKKCHGKCNDEENARYKQIANEACKAGSADACYLFSPAHKIKDDKERYAAYDKFCDQKVALACMMMIGDQKVFDDLIARMKYARASCAYHNKPACDMVVTMEKVEKMQSSKK